MKKAEKKQKFKKVKDTILIYFHTGIYFKFQAPMLNDEVCQAMTDKQIHKHANKHTY